MKKISMLLLLLLVILSSSCNDDNVTSGEYLDKEHPFVGGLIAVGRDSLDGPFEVFYGTVKPNNNPPMCPLGQDEFLRRLLLTLRGTHFLEFKGKTGAKVELHTNNGAVIELSDIGNGIYRDLNKAVKFLPKTFYKLVVKDGSDTYYSSLNTLDTIEFINKSDSLFTKKFPNEPIGGIAYTAIKEIEKAFFYTNRNFYYDKALKGEIISLDHTFDPNDLRVVMQPETRHPKPVYEIYSQLVITTAYDSLYGKIYMPDIGYSGSDDFNVWYMRTEDISITKKSNITGPNSVVGVFGSLSQKKKTFILIPPNE